jgi:hypothetical protein
VLKNESDFFFFRLHLIETEYDFNLYSLHIDDDYDDDDDDDEESKIID